jgi:hypothetical protein
VTGDVVHCARSYASRLLAHAGDQPGQLTMALRPVAEGGHHQAHPLIGTVGRLLSRGAFGSHGPPPPSRDSGSPISAGARHPAYVEAEPQVGEPIFIIAPPV